MITTKVEKALHSQLALELNSAYHYLGSSVYFEMEGLKGFAKWMRSQTKEETEHAMKIYHYLFDRRQSVILPKIESPKTTWASVAAVFEDGLNHEKKVSESINILAELALKEKDHATVHFLQWFLSEQVEEEALFEDIIRKLHYIGTNKTGLVMLDKELGNRE